MSAPADPNEFTGKRVLVSGGTKGLGRANPMVKTAGCLAHWNKAEAKGAFEAAAALRKQISQDVLERFEARLLRGVAIGRLQKNTCTACNMSITATALADLHHVPADELASCPECQAILIR